VKTAAYSSYWFLGGIVAAAVFSVLAWAISSSGLSAQALPPQPVVTVQQIGDSLMHRYVLPLEIMGLLLTAALIGAVVIANWSFGLLRDTGGILLDRKSGPADGG